MAHISTEYDTGRAGHEVPMEVSMRPSVQEPTAPRGSDRIVVDDYFMLPSAGEEDLAGYSEADKSHHMETYELDGTPVSLPVYELPITPLFCEEHPRCPTSENGQRRYSIPPTARNLDTILSSTTWITRAWIALEFGILNVLAHWLYEPFNHTLTIFQAALLLLQTVPDVADITSSWLVVQFVPYYFLIAIFAIYSLQTIAEFLVARSTIFEKTPKDGFPKGDMSSSTYVRYALEWYVSRVFGFGIERERHSIVESYVNIFSTPLRRREISRKLRNAIAEMSLHERPHIWLNALITISFWISIAIDGRGSRATSAASIFYTISCLRILTLLGLTNGTLTVLRRLKIVLSRIHQMLLLIVLAWVLFAILGVQTFSSELNRSCVWPNTTTSLGNISNGLGFGQSCGGWLDTNGSQLPWQQRDGRLSTSTPRGYLCPQPAVCIEGKNPYNGALSFDDLGHSLELVFVVMSGSSFGRLLYHIIDSSYLSSALYFAIVYIIIRLWLLNVLTSLLVQIFIELGDFKTPKPPSRKTLAPDEESMPRISPTRPKNTLKDRYYNGIWLALILYSFICQCTCVTGMRKDKARFLAVNEFAVSVLLLIEVAIRGDFFERNCNIADLVIAIITTIISVPHIGIPHRAYATLSLFQILRMYRIVIVLPFTGKLFKVFLTNASGLFSLVLFLLLATALVALLAAELFRGTIPSSTVGGNAFSQPLNSFIGACQVLSTDHWPAIMFNLSSWGNASASTVLGPLFMILWFIGRQAVLTTCLAIFQRGFDLTEQDKYTRQFRRLLVQNERKPWSIGNISLFKMFDIEQFSSQGRTRLDYGPATLEMLLNDAIVQNSIGSNNVEVKNTTQFDICSKSPRQIWWREILIGAAWRLQRNYDEFRFREPNPFRSQLLQTSQAIDQIDAELAKDLGSSEAVQLKDTSSGLDEEGILAEAMPVEKEVALAAQRKNRAEEEYLLKYPNYDRPLFLFGRNNLIRNLCQRITYPGRGERKHSTKYRRLLDVVPPPLVFENIINAIIVAMVVQMCVATPLYIQSNFGPRVGLSGSWFAQMNLSFAVVFTCEAFIRTIADGLFWTPYTHWLSFWGLIDAIALVSLWVDLSILLNYGRMPAFEALAALRILRLLKLVKGATALIPAMIGHLSSLLWVVFSAAFLLAGFATYGVSLLGDKLAPFIEPINTYSNLTNCLDGYCIEANSPNFHGALPPGMNFNNFGNAIFTLFQIMSRRGLVDLMLSASRIGGTSGPQSYTFYFIAFNLLSTTFVLMLLLSVFIRSANENTGQALLTSGQKSWVGLRTLLQLVNPAILSSNHRSLWRLWCYRQAVMRHNIWYPFVTVVLVLHLILLCIEIGPGHEKWEHVKDYIFLSFLAVYCMNMYIRLIGLQWARFRRSTWDLYSLVTVTFTAAMGIAAAITDRYPYIYIYHVGLDAIALLIVPRFDGLSRAWSAATRSVLPLGKLLLIWVLCFIIFAIAFTETIGLASLSGKGMWTINFQTVPNTLILLFRLSIGDQWPQLMGSVASIAHLGCDDENGQCVNAVRVRVLFTLWNILCMYFFSNGCTALVYSHTSLDSIAPVDSSLLETVSSEDIRRFKQAWSVFDPNGLGWVTKEQFPRLLGKLAGLFGMGVYYGEWTVSRINEEVYKPDVNLKRLNEVISRMPGHEFRKRRVKLDMFYSEVMADADPDRGIDFLNLFLILAQYNVLKNREGLELKETLQRRVRLRTAKKQRIARTVFGFFDTMYWSRRFRVHLQRKREQEQQWRRRQPPGYAMTLPSYEVPRVRARRATI